MPRLKISFALARNDFIEKLYNVLDGALGEYYKITVASLIGRTEHIKHWQAEVNDHFEVFSRTLHRPTKSRFNKLKAVQEALGDIQRSDLSFRQSAILRLKGERYKYDIPKSIHVNLPEFEEASEQFYQEVWDIAQSQLK